MKGIMNNVAETDIYFKKRGVIGVYTLFCHNWLLYNDERIEWFSSEY